MQKHFVYGVLVGLILLASAGCNSVPDGQPPQGAIVAVQQPRKELRAREAVNLFATTMSAALLRRFTPGNVIACRRIFEAPSLDLARLPEAVLKSSGDLFEFRIDTSSELVLTSRIRSGDRVGHYRWEMDLRQRDVVIWQEHSEIVVPPKAAVPASTSEKKSTIK